MKTYRWLGAAGAVVLASGFAVTSNRADAAVTIDPQAGDSISCTLNAGAAKLSPGLADNWVQADHQADPGDTNGVTAGGTGNALVTDAVASIPDTPYSAGIVPVTTTSKLSTASCSGTVHQGANTDTILSAALSTTLTSAGTTDTTCKGLITGGPGTQPVTTTVKWKTVGGAKVLDTVITSAITASGTGFALTATSITGSFSGGSSVAQANLDGGTLLALLSTADSSNPDVGVCSPVMGIKFGAAAAGVSDSVAIKLKKPKSLKALGITNVGSTFAISK